MDDLFVEPPDIMKKDMEAKLNSNSIKEKLKTVKNNTCPSNNSAQMFEKEMKKRMLQVDPQQGESTCGHRELWVYYLELYASNINSKYQVNDIDVRSGDFQIFLVGTFSYTGVSHCFAARLHVDGSLVNSGVFDTLNSECWNIVIDPNTDYVAFVGTGYGGYNGKSNALITRMSDTLSNARTVIWSQDSSSSVNQYGRDIAATSDGNLYVTGYLDTGVDTWQSTYGFSSGGIDCFIMKLNATLNKVWAKSFGYSGGNDYCYQISVTRTGDYIYIGGQNSVSIWTEIAFYKLDAYADSVLNSRIIRHTNYAAGSSLQFRRMVMTKKVAFSGTDDRNLLYWCGYTPDKNGDILFGQLSSTLTIAYTYRYGSSDAEFIGDCAITPDSNYLTPDNTYFVGVMTTSHNVARSAAAITYAYSTTGSSNYASPYSSINWCCSNTMYNWWDANLIADRLQIQLRCERQFYNSFTQYITDYNANVYTWATCNYPYFFYFNQITCTLSKVWFNGGCIWNCGGGTSGTTDCDQCVNFGGGCGWCCYSCDIVAGGSGLNVNNAGLKPWYDGGQAPSSAPVIPGNYFQDDEFRKQIYTQWLLPTATVRDGGVQVLTQNSDWRGTMWCEEGNVNTIYSYTEFPLTSGGFTYNPFNDVFDWLFEQDCNGNGSPQDWFIFKIKISEILNINTLPHAAAYFGSGQGNEVATAIQVDENGYIYLAGYTDEQSWWANGATYNNQNRLLLAKTHWELTWEIYEESVTTCAANGRPCAANGHFYYRSTRFVQPNQFRNMDINNGAANFMDSIGTTSAWYYNYYPWGVNQHTQAATNYPWRTTFFGASRLGFTHFYDRFGYGYDTISRMPYTFPIGAYISIDLPRQCHQTPIGNKYYWEKVFFSPEQNILGAAWQTCPGMQLRTQVYNGFQNYAQQYEGTPSGSEKICYLDIKGAAKTDFYSPTTITNSQGYAYDCPYNWQEMWKQQDSDAYTGMKRFQISIRIKITLDDPDVYQPQIQNNIPDITPVIGQKYIYSNINSYFQGTCSYMKVMRSLVSSTNQVTQEETCLPYWMQFYERNNSFVMYPAMDPTVTPTITPITVDVYCCNLIDQCTKNTFTVTPIDNSPNTPTFAALGLSFIVQYDTVKACGMKFAFSQNKTAFTDPDQCTTDTLDTAYDHTSHQVVVDLLMGSQINPGVIGMNSVQSAGLIFGQATSAGTSTVSITYADVYTYKSTSPFGQGLFPITLTLEVNRLPIVVIAIAGNKFPSLYDPTKFWLDINEWIPYFPFLSDHSFARINIMDLNVANWFSDPDGQTLTYSLTYSDGTDRPGWIGFDKTTGALRGCPDLFAGSEYMNLKFMAFDTKYGNVSYYTTLLVNSAPVVNFAGFVALDAYVGVSFGYQFTGLVRDPNGDVLSFSISDSNLYQQLKDNGFVFYQGKNVLQGTPTKPWYSPVIQMTATDVHGGYAIIRFIVRVHESLILRRENWGSMQDQIVEQGQAFFFAIPDPMYVDPTNNSALVFFATDFFGNPLPDWLHFDPAPRSFSGTAQKVQTIKLKIRTMNQYSGLSLDFSFLLTVIPRRTPRLNVLKMPPDIYVYDQEFFTNTLSAGLFIDYNHYGLTLTMKGGNGVKLPRWIHFNKYNRTVSGIANKTGVFRIDIVLSDQQGLKSYVNFKLVVLSNEERLAAQLKKITQIIVYSAILLGGLLIFFVYVYHFSIHFAIQMHKPKKIKKLEASKRVIKKFQDYEEIYIEAYIPDRADDVPLPPSVITYDYDFIRQDKETTSSNNIGTINDGHQSQSLDELNNFVNDSQTENDITHEENFKFDFDEL